jgi:hypothetical protein
VAQYPKLAALLTACALYLLTSPGADASSRPSSGTGGRLPMRVYAVGALDTHGRAAWRFHRGDRVGLRIRWQVTTARPSDREIVIWSVYYGRQAVYRHFRIVPAQVGRWRWTTTVVIPRTAKLGVYTFEGKVVIGHKQSWRVFTFRVRR